MGLFNLTVAFEWIESVKNASFVRGMIYLCPYNAVIALCRWHLLLFWCLLHHNWWWPENPLLICHFRCTAIDTLLLMEHLAVWNLRTHSHWSRKAARNAMRILGAENPLWHFDFGISVQLHPVVTSGMHRRLHGRWFVDLWWLLIVTKLLHVKFL